MHIISLETHQGPDLHSALTRAGHRCDVVHNETHCLKACERARPDAVMVDLETDHVDGEELIREVRTRFPGVQLVAVSAQDDEQVLEHVFRDGATAYLLKPVRTEILTETVNGLASRARPHADERLAQPAPAARHELELLPV